MMTSNQWESLGRGALGMLFLLIVCFIFSNNRRAINWKLVALGIVAQVSFALGILRVNFIKVFFAWISKVFVDVINISHKGGEFMFNKLADPMGDWGYVFAVRVLTMYLIC